MITARLLTVLAASSLAAIAYAQTQPAPSNQPNTAPGYNKAKPHQREMKSVRGNETASPGSRSAPGTGLTTSQTGSMASPNSKSAPGARLTTPASSSGEAGEATRMAEGGPAAHAWSNMPVESPSGQSLGSVSKVVPGLNGQMSSGYVVVSGPNGRSVPVPFRKASSMVRNGKLVLSQSRFEQAPKLTPEDLQNSSDRAWRAKADRYWMRKGRGGMAK